MPLLPPSSAAAPGRRTLLARALGTLTAAGGLGALGASAGCSGGGPGGGDARNAAAERRLRSSAVRQSGALLERYDRTAAAHKELAEALSPLRDAVARHAHALGGGRAEKPARPSEAAPSVPGSPSAALDALAGAERRTAEARTKALVHAPAKLARLLASLAAAGSAHAYLLGPGRDDLKHPGSRATPGSDSGSDSGFGSPGSSPGGASGRDDAKDGDR